MSATTEEPAAPPRAAATFWDKLVSLNERAWAPLETGIALVGDHMLLLGRSMFWLFRRPFRGRMFIESAEFIGVQSLLIVCLIGLFVGMVFALQLTSALRQFGADTMVGATLGLALSRELAPVFCSIVVAARAGAGMATELGSMRITEQIDALSTMALSPIQYLVTPRVVAATLMMPLLCVLFICVGMFGGFAVAVWLLGVDRGVFLENARWIVDPKDIVQGVTKATVFGVALSLIACYQGFNASGGAKGVGVGTTRAVVGSFVTILVLDYFMTDIILTLQGR